MQKNHKIKHGEEEAYDVFEENISDEEEKKEEDLKLSISHKGENGINNPSQ